MSNQTQFIRISGLFSFWTLPAPSFAADTANTGSAAFCIGLVPTIGPDVFPLLWTKKQTHSDQPGQLTLPTPEPLQRTDIIEI